MSEQVFLDDSLRPDQITDPGLLEVWTGFRQQVDELVPQYESTIEMIGAVNEYRARNKTDTDELVSSGKGHIATVATSLLERMPTTYNEARNRERAGNTVASRALGRIHVSGLSRVALELMTSGKERHNGVTRDDLLCIYQDAQTDPRPPRKTLKRALEEQSTCKGFSEVLGRWGEGDASDKDIIDAISDLPTNADREKDIYYALVDVVAGLKGGQIHGPLSKDKKAELLERGFDHRLVTIYEAVSYFELADRTRDTAVIERLAIDREIADMLGITGLKKSRFVADASNEKIKLSDTQRLVANSYNVMVVVQRTRDARKVINGMLLGDDPGIYMGVKQSMPHDEKTIDHINLEFYKRVEERLADNQPTEEMVSQVIELERHKNMAFGHLIGKIDQLRNMVGVAPYSEGRGLMYPQFEQGLLYIDTQIQLETLRHSIDAITSDLQILDEPFRRTADRLREFRGGPQYLRDLSNELMDAGIMTARDVVDTLSMLVLQSKNTPDKTSYFNEVGRTRYYIESKLAELEFLGAGSEYASLLSGALHWIDEMIDSGEVEKITNRELLRFIDEYYIGPDPEKADDDPQPTIWNEDNDTEETEGLAEGTASEPSVDIDGDPASKSAAITNEYILELADILQGVTIEHADVNVFPPGKVERGVGIAIDGPESVRFIDIDPRRLKNLIRLKQSFDSQGRKTSLFYTNHTSWTALPHFVLYVQNAEDQDRGVAVLENPVNGNATYVYAVDGELVKSWKDIAALKQKEARELGARALVHPKKGSDTFESHYDLKVTEHILLLLQ